MSFIFYFTLQKYISDCYTLRELKTAVQDPRADWRLLLGSSCMIVGEVMINVVMRMHGKRMTCISTKTF